MTGLALHDDLRRLLEGHMPFLVSLHEAESLAPLAAAMDRAGEVKGSALVLESEERKSPSVEEAIAMFAEQHHAAARDGEIRASAIFYHGRFDASDMRPARTVDEASCIVALLEHVSRESVTAVIAYHRSGQGRWKYAEPVILPKPAAIFA
ncbi:MAG: hypothetical protein HYY79_08350 [Betaproteobacteria bacterium]|nr:hypothetical protein [Betaproteobacteria bacterium]